MSYAEVETKVTRIRNEGRGIIAGYKTDVDALNTDPSRTADYKRQRSRELHDAAKAELQNLRQQELDIIDKGVAKVSRALTGNSAALTGMDAIAQRDADERASKVKDQAEARDVMQRALHNQDAILARAIFARSLELGFSEAANAYTAANDVASTTMDDYTELKRLQGRSARLERDMFFGSIRPGR